MLALSMDLPDGMWRTRRIEVVMEGVLVVVVVMEVVVGIRCCLQFHR